MRIETGVDLARTIAIAHWLEERFGRKVPGLLTKAGTFPADREALPGSRGRGRGG